MGTACCCSTNGVFPHNMKGCTEDADVSDQWPYLTDGYSQSKWVAEQLVHRAGQRGLPVTIYRLGAHAQRLYITYLPSVLSPLVPICSSRAPCNDISSLGCSFIVMACPRFPSLRALRFFYFHRVFLGFFLSFMSKLCDGCVSLPTVDWHIDGEYLLGSS